MLNVSPFRLITKQGWSLLWSLFIIIGLEILAGKIREEKEIKEIQIEKKSVKLSVFRLHGWIHRIT